MRCLWLSGEYPYPADAGILAYAAGTARALAGAGARVVALCLRREGAAHEARDDGVEWRPVPSQPRPRARSLVDPLPAMAYSLATPAYSSAIARSLAQAPWDAVIIHHLQMAWALPVLRRAAPAARPPLVFMAQNHEASVRRAVAGAHPRKLARPVLRVDAAKVARLERAAVAEADLVTAITSQDAAQFAATAPERRYLVLEPGYEGPRVARRTITEQVPRRAVIFGSVEWHVKQANLRAFLAVADPLFAAAGAEVRVVGRAPAAFVRELAPRLRATSFVGPVADPSGELASARLGLVAERTAGGFQLKALDYVFHRLPVAALHRPPPGLPFGDGGPVLCFPDELALARGALAALDDLPRLNALQEAAYRACERRFDWDERGRRLHDAIAAVAGDRARPPGDGAGGAQR